MKLREAKAELEKALYDEAKELARTAIANAQHEIRISLAGLESAQSLVSALTQEVIRLRSLCSGLFLPLLCIMTRLLHIRGRILRNDDVLLATALLRFFCGVEAMRTASSEPRPRLAASVVSG